MSSSATSSDGDIVRATETGASEPVLKEAGSGFEASFVSANHAAGGEVVV